MTAPESHLIDPKSVHAQWEVSVYYVSRSAYTSLRLIDMVHPHWIISHVRQGEVATTTRGVEAQAPVGFVMVHPPGLPFCELASQSGMHEWLAFEARRTSAEDLFRLFSTALTV